MHSERAKRSNLQDLLRRRDLEPHHKAGDEYG